MYSDVARIFVRKGGTIAFETVLKKGEVKRKIIVIEFITNSNVGFDES